MNKKKFAIIFVSIALTIGTIAGGFYLYNEKQKELNPSGLSGYILGEGMDPDLTPEEIAEMLQKQVDESKVAFSIYSEPTFEGKKGKIMFANPQYSAHNIDLTVTVDNRTIIRTEKIAPNQYIEDIEILGKALKKGEHKGAGMITAYSRETGEEVGKVAVDMIIKSE